jgi:hypothetical protein
MRLLAGLVLVLALTAPSAAADTIAPSAVTDGPVLAGDRAVWADVTPSDAVRLLTMRPAGRPAVARRWEQPSAPGSNRAVWSVAAGGSRAAAIVGTCTHSGGYELARCAPHAFSGPFARLRGPRLPERVARRCRRDVRNPREVAVSGRWRAVLVERFCPSLGIESLGARRRIEVRGGGRRLQIPAGNVHGLRLAGRYLAWQQGFGRAVLYDLRRGERVRRVGSARRSAGGVDVQADGTIAFTRFEGAGRTCVTTISRAGAERVVACRAESVGGSNAQTGGSGGIGPDPTVAIAAGRVLYARFGQELVLQRPGGEPAVLARFNPARVQRVGGFDLGPDAAVWARQRVRFSRPPGGMPSGPENVGRPQVVLRRL